MFVEEFPTLVNIIRTQTSTIKKDKGMPKFEIWNRLNEWDAYHKINDTPYYKSLYQPSNTYSNKGQKLKAPYLNLD